MEIASTLACLIIPLTDFSASAEITAASPESDNQFVLTCTAYSNPNTIIQDHTISRAIPGQPNTKKTTAHGCQTVKLRYPYQPYSFNNFYI